MIVPFFGMSYEEENNCLKGDGFCACLAAASRLEQEQPALLR